MIIYGIHAWRWGILGHSAGCTMTSFAEHSIAMALYETHGKIEFERAKIETDPSIN